MCCTKKEKRNVFLRIMYVHTEYLGAPNLVILGKKLCSVSRNISTGYDISISVSKIRDMDTISRYIVSCDVAWYGI